MLELKAESRGWLKRLREAAMNLEKQQWPFGPDIGLYKFPEDVLEDRQKVWLFANRPQDFLCPNEQLY